MEFDKDDSFSDFSRGKSPCQCSLKHLKQCRANKRAFKIFIHYLAIKLWKPNFNPVKATIDNITAWVSFLGLAIEYYEE
ncbi:hypothetical protein Ahy_A05g023486 [Arachis hypogaea]|uniref:Uncharacterized protein n=1 Tax=Arachis hypogaea TaxID=3818 RepID=A0A445D3H1_ARAHY|nr:hypothetical protein Ahy_A05g023486 [Arachis hypogaea]